MSLDFSDMEQSVILNMITTKSHRAIALLLDRDIADVSEFIKVITDGTDIVTHQSKLEANPARVVKVKLPFKEKLKKFKEKKIAEPKGKKVTAPAAVKVKRSKKANTEKEREREIKDQKKRNNEERLNIERDRKNLRRLPQYKTREIDYSKQITVMIDKKTAIYVKAGEDIEAAKKLYLDRVERQKVSNQARDNKNKIPRPLKKICLRCDAEKLVDEFDKNRGCPDGYENTCKQCKKNVKKIKEYDNHFTL